MMSAIEAVSIVDAVLKSKKRIPSEYVVFTFFSIHDIWLYNIVIDDRLCEICTDNAVPFTYSGNHIRRIFPYLEIEGVNRIKVHGHMPRDDNCRCWLERVTNLHEGEDES